MADRFVMRLPKCELHVHLEGTLEHGHCGALADRHGLAPPAARPASYDGLADFLADYYAAVDCLRSEDDFRELARAYLATARSQGVTHTEMFFDPQAHTSRGVPFEAVVTGIHRAQEESAAEGGPTSALILCLLRDAGAESAEETLAASLPFREWIVGIGLDSDERGHPPAEYADLFSAARAEGYRLTMHCDPLQPEALTNLWQCVELIGVERIDHGVDCLRDDRLVAELARRHLGLTVCPLSNLRLYGDLMGEAVTEMLDRGLLVTVNSDDPAYFGGYVADNYEALADAAGLSRAELGRLARHGFEAAWLPPAERAAHLRAVDDYLTA
ncbi:MAG: adenosine deaminase [Acidimicrobiales bacterium]